MLQNHNKFILTEKWRYIFSNLWVTSWDYGTYHTHDIPKIAI